MSPILGIWASQNYSRYSLPTSYESIATATVSTATSSVTFSSIPSGYTHLQIRASIVPAGEDNIVIEFNADNGNNYSAHQIQGDGASATAYAITSSTMYIMGLMQNNSNAPFRAVYDILDYKDTSKYKTVRGLAGQDGNTASTGYRVGLHSGNWRSTSAITSIKLYTVYGNFIGANSHIALYGIKGE